MALHSRKQQKARALKMLESKILKGKTNAEVAEEFGVTEQTVRKCLTLAEKADIVVAFEDKLYGQLLPLAHDAVAGALQDGNAKIGLAILQGTQVLRPQNTRTAAQAVEDDELARYIVAKRVQAQIAKDTLDGELASPGAPPHESRALPAAPEVETGLPPGPAGNYAENGPGLPGPTEIPATGAAGSGAPDDPDDEPDDAGD